MAVVGTDSLDRRLLRFRTSPSVEDGRAFARELALAGRSADAIEVAGHVLADEPEDAAMQMLVGQAWAKEGDLVRAQKALLEALRLAPNDKEPYRLLADVLMKRGDPARAIKVLDRGLAIDATDAMLLGVRARAERLLSIADTGGVAVESPQPVSPPPPARPVAPPAVARPAPPAPAKPVVPPARPVAPPPPAIAKPSAPPAGLSASASYRPPPPRAQDYDEDWESEATVVRSDLSEQLSQQMATASKRRDDTASRGGSRPSEGPSTHRVAALADAEARHTIPIEEPTRPMSLESIQAMGGVQALGRTSSPSRASTPVPAPPAPVKGAAQANGRPRFDSDRPTMEVPAYADPQLVRVPAPASRPQRAAAHTHQTDDVDSVLALLERTRIFEPPSGEPVTWVVPTRAERAGSRVGRAVLVVWFLGLLAVGGGYAGFRHHDQQQRARAASLVTRAETLSRLGEHHGLIEAHALLTRARALSPLDPRRAELALVIASQRALEEGDVPAGVVLATIAATTEARPSQLHIDVARAVATWSRGDRAGTLEAVTKLTPRVQSNGMLAYLVGRIAQRMGAPDSRALLDKALERTPDLPPAEIALAVADADEMKLGDAVARIDRVLARHRTHLRARLWGALLRADELEPQVTLAAVRDMTPALRQAGSTDRVLAALVRARALRRSGDDTAAGREVDTAVSEGGTNARLLLLVAREAIALGHLARGAQAATAALLLAPHLAEGRRVLGEIHVRRRDGLRALDVLGTLPPTDVESRPWVARALLLVGQLEDAARTRATELVGQLAESTEPSDRAIGLRLRVAVDPSTASAALTEAKTLARSAPGVPDVMRAVADIALTTGDTTTATDAARRLVTAEPRSIDAALLLGRALVAGGGFDEAKTVYARAVSLDATEPEALAGLATCELALGAYAEAEGHFATLTTLAGHTREGSPSTVGRLGRAEALLGLGRVADAKVQLEGLPVAERARPRAQVAAARIALVDGRPGEAVTLIRAQAENESAPTDLIVLYGEALLVVGEAETAGVQFARALARDAAHPEALLGAATVFIRDANFRDAGDVLGRARRALEARPRGPGTTGRLLMLIGRTELEQGHVEQGRTFLRQATQREGVPAEAWFYLGESLSGANSPDARAAYERYLTLDPNGPHADRARRAIR